MLRHGDTTLQDVSAGDVHKRAVNRLLVIYCCHMLGVRRPVTCTPGVPNLSQPHMLNFSYNLKYFQIKTKSCTYYIYYL